LEAIQSTNSVFTPDELYTHLCCFEEKLKQVSDYHIKPKQVAFSAQSNVKYFNLSIFYYNFIQTLDHEVSKDATLLSKMFNDMLTFEKKINKEKEE
jgi:hypothetical protein